MTAIPVDILARGRELAQSLRHEGRQDDALVIDTLVRAIDDSPRYFTTGEVARRLGVSRQTIVNWIKQGYLPGVRIGARMVVPASAFDRYAEFEEIFNREKPALSPEEAAEIVGRGREKWTWVEKDT